MKRTVVYRPFEQRDTAHLAEVISQSWSYEKMFSKNTAYHFSHIFLYYELSRQSSNRVVEVEGRAAGIITSAFKSKHKRRGFYIMKVLKHGLQMAVTAEGRNVLLNYVKAVDELNSRMLNSLNEPFKAELSLFAVSPSLLGLGTGSALFNDLLLQLKKNQIETYYLYTDTTCNFGFYDYKGLERASAVKRYIKTPVNKEIEFFIYKGYV